MTYNLHDLNARFGKASARFLEGKPEHMLCSYEDSADPIMNPNNNARHAITALQQLFLLNNLKGRNFSFKGARTFRQGSRFVSELDVCFVSPELVDCVYDFHVEQRTDLPSNHAPITVSLDLTKCDVDMSLLLTRATELGSHAVLCTRNSKHISKRQIRMSDLNTRMFSELIQNVNPPDLTEDSDLDTVISNMNDVLYSQAVKARSHTQSTYSASQYTRWEGLLEEGDPKLIWKAIRWNGQVNATNTMDTPSDDDFKLHFERLLNPPGVDSTIYPDIEGTPYIPITDDPINAAEVEEAIQHTKANKGGGISGVSPGILKLLPINWIFFLASLFTWVFTLNIYPSGWRCSRYVTIFKKGLSYMCDNYRGISILGAVGKLYDTVLCKRLEKWFIPDREQAGSQKGRGCTEHIVTLRLLINYALCKKEKLYVIFVDFSKAYDRVPRAALIHVMKSLGCGATMLLAVATAYSNTQLALGAALITTVVGVRQGSPTSCLLFTLYVNRLIKAFKTQCASDGFLRNLHSLMLMDDTVILATSRPSALHKLQVLSDFCSESGMIINEGKTQFMVINGSPDDHQPLHCSDIVVENCESYIYLGSPFTQDGKIQTAVKIQGKMKACHVLKYQSFIKKNCDFPFSVKKTVLDAALLTSVFYGCEGWLCKQLDTPQQLYMTAIKTLLGVRRTTPNNLCLIEIGYPTATGYVRSIQSRFFRNIIAQREGMDDDPFWLAWSLAKAARTPCARYISDLLGESDPRSSDIHDLKEKVSQAESTKSVTYCNDINPDLEIHTVYTAGTPVIPEYQRQAFTKLRLSAHSLAIETGRWSRTPREQRLCDCGQIQTENHIISECPTTAHIRAHFSSMDTFRLPDLFKCDDSISMCTICYSCLASY